MIHPNLTALQSLPPLWETETHETSDIVLRLRFTCPWHGLNWLPVEFDQALGVAYGLTVHMVPEWRHFNVTELTAQFGGQSVIHDKRFFGGRVPVVANIAQYHLDDITTFYPHPLPDLGLR
jgi:hypothetical protein